MVLFSLTRTVAGAAAAAALLLQHFTAVTAGTVTGSAAVIPTSHALCPPGQVSNYGT